MSFKGHIVCKQCRLVLTLGKLRTLEGQQMPQGFRHAVLGDTELGQVVLAFLAQHIKHEVMVVGDTVLEDMDDLSDYSLLSMIDDGCPWATSHTPIIVGSAKFYAIPMGRT